MLFCAVSGIFWRRSPVPVQSGLGLGNVTASVYIPDASGKSIAVPERPWPVANWSHLLPIKVYLSLHIKKTSKLLSNKVGFDIYRHLSRNTLCLF
jgi:hypothetical protein